MDWCLLLILITLMHNRKLHADTDCIRLRHHAKNKRFADPSFRYRPKFTSCRTHQPECSRYHKYLLLVTNSEFHELLRECSASAFLENAAELEAHLSKPSHTLTAVNSAIVVVHSSFFNQRFYLDLVNVMMSRLGNVSLFLENRGRYPIVSDMCDTLAQCTNLLSLESVIEQNKQWNIQAQPIQISSSLLDLYDPRWLPITSTLSGLRSGGQNYQPAVDFQLQLLASSICARSRRYNLFFEILPTYYEETTDDHLDTLDNTDSETPESRLELLDILPLDPRKYDKNRPPKTKGQPTLVDFHVTVLSLDSINEEAMTYIADIFLAQSWRDQRLRLPESMGEYRILNVDWLNDIWKPDSFFKNAKHVTFHEISVPNHYLWLYHDKTLLYMSKLSLVLSCAMKFESYPHDTQVCSMMIESLSHTTHDLIFRWNATDPLVVNPKIELPQLDIAHNYTADCTIEYSTGNFTCLAVIFSLRRRLGYHLFHTYIPSALIVVMSWISFWIKPEAIPARVTLGVTSLLTLATQNTQSQQSLPPVSYVKAIDIWMSSCSVFVFLSLMEFAIVNNYMGPVATKAMKGYSDEDINLEEDIKELHSATETPIRSAANVPQYPTFCNGKAIAIYIDKFSRIFFPFSFIVLNIAYWTSFL